MTTDLINQGKKLTLVAIGLMVGLSLLTILFYNFTLGSQKILQQAIRLLFTIGLAFFMYKGQTWARLVIAILMLLGSVTGILGSIAIIGDTSSKMYGLFFFILAMIYGLVGIMLLFSSSIKQFLDHQKLSNSQTS